MNTVFQMTAGIESVGERLTRIREEKGYTQKELAIGVGVSQQTIGNIERKGSGSTKMPEIAEFLGVNINYLMKGESQVETTLSLVAPNDNSGYSIEDIREKFPRGIDKAINTVRNLLLQQGKLVDGDILLIKNKDLISNVFLKCILIELTNDLFINDNISDNPHKTEQKESTKL